MPIRASPINLSVWENVEALERFVYQTVHKRFYGRRAEWFEHFEDAVFRDVVGARRAIGRASRKPSRGSNIFKQHGPSDHAFGWAACRNLETRGARASMRMSGYGEQPWSTCSKTRTCGATIAGSGGRRRKATGNEPSRERSILGQCRRRAPSPLVADLPDHGRHYPAWATTKRDDWCGEHEHIQQ